MISAMFYYYNSLAQKSKTDYRGVVCFVKRVLGLEIKRLPRRQSLPLIIVVLCTFCNTYSDNNYTSNINYI